MDKFCRRCVRDILDQTAFESFAFIILRKPAEIRASAKLGCRACAIFEANLSLWNGFESRMELHEQCNMNVSAKEEYLMSKYGADAWEDFSDIPGDELEGLKQGRIMIYVLLGRDLIPLMGTMLLPWTPMAFVLRRDEGEFQDYAPDIFKLTSARNGSFDTATRDAH